MVKEKNTTLLVVPKKPEANRYRFSEMIKYAESKNKSITELSMEEKAKFKI